MGEKYSDPPLIEAVCAFRLPPESKWDLTIPGLMYPKLTKNYPGKEQRPVSEVELKQTEAGIVQNISTSERVFFHAENRNAFVQLGPNLLSVHCLKPYPTWQSFQPRIDEAFKALTETVAISALERVGLRYINRIEIPSLEVDLDHYFDFRPYLGERLPQAMVTFLLGCELPMGEGKDCCRVQLSRAVASEEGSSAFMLDVDYFAIAPRSVVVDQALDWVEKAHAQVESVFEGCITDASREIFRRLA